MLGDLDRRSRAGGVLIALVAVLAGGACTGRHRPAPASTSARPGVPPVSGLVWQRLATAPTQRTEVPPAAARTRVYVEGGGWSPAAGPPTTREHWGGAGFGGLVYRVGGRLGRAGNLAAFEVYAPRTGRWSRLPDLPTRRGGLAAAATCNGRVIAVGGEGTATFPQVEAFDVRAGTWQALPPLPTPRHGPGVVALGPVLYTFAGGPRPGLFVADGSQV